MPASRVIIFLSVLLPASIGLALASGAMSLSMAEIMDALRNPSQTGSAQLVVTQIRMPRVALAAIIGAILATSGAAMQGLFRNPLADPSLIGVTAGASFGASVVIVMGPAAGSGLLGLSLASLGAFIGGLAAVLLVYRLATSANGTSVAAMLLAGIAITALAGSATHLLQFFGDNEMLRRISLWQMGGLEGANYTRLAVAGLVASLLMISLPFYSVALNALLLGESEARHLGIRTERVKSGLIVVVAIAVGTSVALAGTIAFVGLVVPHLVRMLIGPDHRSLLPASALAGACLLVLADAAARVIMAPTELPVGILTAAIGVPFFLSLLRRRQQYGMA